MKLAKSDRTVTRTRVSSVLRWTTSWRSNHLNYTILRRKRLDA